VTTVAGNGTRVDWRSSLALVGTVVRYLSAALVVPLVVALVYGGDRTVAVADQTVRYGADQVTFAVSILIALAAGLALERLDPDPDLGAREGFLMVAVTWLLVSVVGAVPYVIAAVGVPMLFEPTAPASTLGHPANALFESMSGFTTTGATVMGSISFETHSHAMLIWRQLTQWLGGMGIVVLAVAILPELSVGGAQLMDAEAPGVGIEKLTPRIAETARVLWLAYLAFTVAEFLLLYGLHLAGMAPQMGLYNAIAHPLTTMPTGGFSPEADSIAAFSAAVQWVVIPFMVAAGTNFALFWHVIAGDPRRLVHDAEFHSYLGIMGVAAAVLVGLLVTGAARPALMGAAGVVLGPVVPGAVEPALRQAAFQVVSLVTTTGYATSNFAGWSEPAKYLLLVAIFVGGSGGSTGGAIKIIRWIVIAKAIRRELFTTAHPDAVRPVRLAGRVIDETAIRGIFAFTMLYLGIFAIASVVVGIDAARVGFRLSAFETASAVAATLGNVGPGFGALGPFGSYRSFSPFSKLLMVFLMWIGRLEIIPVLVLLTGGYWRS